MSSSSPPFKVKAVYDYTSPHEDDLSFPNGQVITVTEEEEADWYYGEYESPKGKKEGLFPRNFVERYEPETPPRPVRPSRPKKDSHAPAPEDTAPAVSAEAQDVQEREEEPSKADPPTSKKVASPPAIAPSAPVVDPPAASTGKVQSKPAPPIQGKPAAPAVAEKPSGGSFKDRIAAFNKPTAPPVAPFKPGGLSSGGSGFIKKPFVAPPPSKNAYVPPPRDIPPQKVYRREDDPDLQSKDEDDSTRPTPIAPATEGEPNDGQPKPTSLKDRIALLQKQQLEQAARHAEAAQRKQEASRTPKQTAEPLDESEEDDNEDGGSEIERVESAETAGKGSLESSRDDTGATGRPSRRRPSREPSHVTSPVIGFKDMPSDANDADQSGAGDTTEDAEETSTGRDDSDYKPRAKALAPPPRAVPVSRRDTEQGDEEDEEEEGNAGEMDEEDVDPEIRRRLEIRNRMAKMSGGMGMPGMFGASPLPAAGPKKQRPSGGHERKTQEPTVDDSAQSPSTSQLPPVPVMPSASRQVVMSPEQDDRPLAVEKEEEEEAEGMITATRGSNVIPDVEEVKPEAPPRQYLERKGTQPKAQGRPPPPTPSTRETAAHQPPVSAERPVPPPPPSGNRPLPPQPPPVPMSPSAGSESDDEMSLHTKQLSLKTPGNNSSPEGYITQPPVPARPDPTSPESSRSKRMSEFGAPDHMSPVSPVTPGSSSRRSNRAPPPIPGSSPVPGPPSQARAPPPPPPTAAPPSRRSTGDTKPIPSPRQAVQSESDEEVTEYDGDYDTDIAPGAKHKDALKAHARESSMDESTTMDDTPVRTPVLGPSSQPPPVPQSSAPRAVPPPLPSQAPPAGRPPSDMPRAAPPPVPPTRDERPKGDEYDPFNYNAASAHSPPSPASDVEEDDMYAPPPTSSQQRQAPSRPPQAPPHQDRAAPPPPPSQMPPASSSLDPSSSSRGPPRKSLEVQRSKTGPRHSGEQGRPSGEQGFIATDVDLGESSGWWTQYNIPPPALANRRDVLYEIEESTSQRGGKNTVSKEVFILYQDYSQTVVTARFDPSSPHTAALSQRHQAPPLPLRQDQLEDVHARFGSALSSAAEVKQNTVVGDGEPQSLILELLRPLASHGALLPIGSRAFGALVYANLANASVTQHDELRSGDVITFRNARFQGHRGGLHQKYSAEVGKPEHVGVVVDWDGTKKKVRVWEQGRESKKVKIESFRLGDLRSGEVKIWRVVDRGWVGWEGGN
ncbi:MAG: hypothetical protein M1833_004051 [Piccolia ochrophora]|nr:MAG: hypothetical protein M1833_004051 [Piccolia ochrophora]